MELTGLEGRPCAAHGNPIKVRKIAGAWRAICVTTGAGPHCDTAVLSAWAASLNGHGHPGAKVAAEGTSGPARAMSEESDAPVKSTEASAKDENENVSLLVTQEPVRANAESSSGNGTGQGRNGHRYAQVPDLLRRLPPQDLEAEKSVLGAVLLANVSIETANRLLRAQDFYRESHRVLFRAMQILWRSKAAIDVVTLKAQLSQDELELVGGVNYLAELAQFVPTARHIEHYAGIVKSRAMSRQIATSATELATLAYEGVSADALVSEMERRIKALSTDAGQQSLPQLIDRDIEILSGRQFADRHKQTGKRHWLVEGFLAAKEISLWSGKVEAGKTTLMRTLVMCLARGELFLGRHTYPSRVLYVMLDADGEDLTHDEFKLLGWDEERDEIDFLVDPVMALRPNSFEQFHQKLLEIRPQFVVIDPLGRFQKIADFLGYETTYAMAQFSELAKRTDTHIALLHHIPRGRSDTDDVATAGFGSIAIAGGCNARFVCGKKTGGIYTLATSKGKGGGFRPFEGEQSLDMDPATHWVTLRGLYDWKEQARAIEPAILETIERSDERLTAQELGRLVGVQRSIAGAAAKSLAHNGMIRLIVERGNKHFFTRKELNGIRGELSV